MATPVKYITGSSDAPYDAILQVITTPGVAYLLRNPLHAGQQNAANDLSDIPGLRQGDEFQIRLLTGISTAAASSKVLSYSSTTSKNAFFRASGTAALPVLTFEKLEDQ